MKFFNMHNATLEQFGTSANKLKSTFEQEAIKHLINSNKTPQVPQDSNKNTSGLIDELQVYIV